MTRYLVYSAPVTADSDEHALTHRPTRAWPWLRRCVSYPGDPVTLAAGHAGALAAVDDAQGSRGVLVRVVDVDRHSTALFSRDLPPQVVDVARECVKGVGDLRDVAGTEIRTPAPDHQPTAAASIALWQAYLRYAAADRSRDEAQTLARAARDLLLGRAPQVTDPPEPVALDPACAVRAAVHELVLAADVAGLAAPTATDPALAELLLALGITATAWAA